MHCVVGSPGLVCTLVGSPGPVCTLVRSTGLHVHLFADKAVLIICPITFSICGLIMDCAHCPKQIHFMARYVYMCQTVQCKCYTLYVHSSPKQSLDTLPLIHLFTKVHKIYISFAFLYTINNWRKFFFLYINCTNCLHALPKHQA